MSYPKYFNDVRNEYKNVSFPETPQQEVLEPFGYFPVLDSEIPEGDVITEGTPAKGEDGKWYKTYTSRNYTEEELIQVLAQSKQEKIDSTSLIIQNDLDQGYSFTLDDEQLTTKLTDEDIAKLICFEAYVNSSSDTTFSYYFNEKFKTTLTKQQALDFISQSLSYRYKIYMQYWAFTSSVNSATKVEDLPEVPDTFRS